MNKGLIWEITAIGLFALLAISIQLNVISYNQSNSICNITKVETRQQTMFNLSNEFINKENNQIREIKEIKEAYNIDYYHMNEYGIEWDERLFGIIKYPINEGNRRIICKIK